MNNNPYYARPSAGMTRAGETSLISRVSYLLCTTLLVTAAAAYYAAQIGLGRQWFLPLAIGTFACVFGINFTRTKPLLSLVLLYGLSILEGLLLGPMLGAIARGYPYGTSIIGEAATLSAVIVAGVGSYVWISGKDFGNIGKFLMIGIIGLIVVGVVGIFVHFSAGAHLLYSIVGAASVLLQRCLRAAQAWQACCSDGRVCSVVDHGLQSVENPYASTLLRRCDMRGRPSQIDISLLRSGLTPCASRWYTSSLFSWLRREKRTCVVQKANVRGFPDSREPGTNASRQATATFQFGYVRG